LKYQLILIIRFKISIVKAGDFFIYDIIIPLEKWASKVYYSD